MTEITPTPRERPPIVPKVTIDRLLWTLSEVQRLEGWLLSLLRECHSGRVADWEAEREARSAELQRRYIDLESACGPLP
jgi:hypothetical protein